MSVDQDCAFCVQDSKPFAAEDPNYVPKGNMITFDNVNAYIVGNGPTCIVFIHDVFGLPTGFFVIHWRRGFQMSQSLHQISFQLVTCLALIR